MTRAISQRAAGNLQQDVSAPPVSASFWARRIHAALRHLAHGSLRLRDGGTERIFGQGAPAVTVTVHRPRFYRRLALGGSVGAGEAYMDGDWDSDDLVGVVRLLAANRAAMGALDGAGTLSVQAANLLQHLTRGNSRHGSRRNIAAHYDLSNAFFANFLDARMMYSSAVYEHDAMTLEQASTAKLERLCRKLELSPAHHLLEVGSGWGGLAEYAAARFGCRVTTATISPAQHETAVARIRRAGLEDRVEVLLRDYRDLDGRYDRIISVEMVEAVGERYLDGYFHTLGRLLAPHGLLALQAITIEDSAYRPALRIGRLHQEAHLSRQLHSVRVGLVSPRRRNRHAVLVNLEDIGASTMPRRWRSGAAPRSQRRARVLALGFDERFVRMWRFYLAYCEGGFRERAISDVQLLFAKPAYRRPAVAGALTGNQVAARHEPRQPRQCGAVPGGLVRLRARGRPRCTSLWGVAAVVGLLGYSVHARTAGRDLVLASVPRRHGLSAGNGVDPLRCARLRRCARGTGMDRAAVGGRRPVLEPQSVDVQAEALARRPAGWVSGAAQLSGRRAVRGGQHPRSVASVVCPSSGFCCSALAFTLAREGDNDTPGSSLQTTIGGERYESRSSIWRRPTWCRMPWSGQASAAWWAHAPAAGACRRSQARDERSRDCCASCRVQPHRARHRCCQRAALRDARGVLPTGARPPPQVQLRTGTTARRILDAGRVCHAGAVCHPGRTRGRPARAGSGLRLGVVHPVGRRALSGSQITAVSNSSSQRRHIEWQARSAA
jgi:cyclopropane-fatty-acyl-phospholipid synthase